MVEKTGAENKSTIKPPNAEEELARAEQYAAMMAAVAREEYDNEDAEFMESYEDEELEKQRRILAAMATAARKQGLGLEDLEESEEIMRQIYEENLYFQQNQKQVDHQNQRSEQDQISMALKAEALASGSGLNPEALKMLQEQQMQAQLNPPPMGCSYDPRLTGLAGVEEGDVLNGMIPPNQAMALS